MIGCAGIQLGTCGAGLKGGGALDHSGIALEGSDHVVQLGVVVLAVRAGLHKLGIQLDVIHADPAAVDVAPVEAVDRDPLSDGDPAAQRRDADQGIGGTGSAADVHAGGAVHNGAAHAVADGAIAVGGGGNGNIVQVDPALVDQTPGHAVHNFLAQDDHGGAGRQSGDLGIARAGPGTDVQADGAADHGGAAGGDIAAGLGVLLELHIAHGDPALVDVAPGRIVHGGLLIHGDLGALVQLGSEGVGHTGSGTDVDLGSAGDHAGGAAGQGGISNGGILLIAGVGQEDPALGAVAPAASRILHKDGDFLAALQDTQLVSVGAGGGADIDIVVGNGNSKGRRDLGHTRRVIIQLDPAAGGQIEPLGAADHSLCHHGDRGVPLDLVDLRAIGAVEHFQHHAVAQPTGFVNDIGRQGIAGLHILAAGLLPAGGEGLAGGGGADAAHQRIAIVPAQEGVAGHGGSGHLDLLAAAAVEDLDLILRAGGIKGHAVAGIEQGIAHAAGVGGAVSARNEQVGNGHPAGKNAAVGVIVHISAPVIGADGTGKLRGRGVARQQLLYVPRPAGVAALGIGQPHQSVQTLLGQAGSRHGRFNSRRQSCQLLAQEDIGVGLGNGLPLGAGGAVTDLIYAGARVIGILMEAHRLLDHPNAGLADPAAGRGGRGGDRCCGNQTDQQHEGKHQASKSLFHRNLLLY